MRVGLLESLKVPDVGNVTGVFQVPGTKPITQVRYMEPRSQRESLKIVPCVISGSRPKEN